MRVGKDETKLMDPLFPRLHINDTEKGGPRAPPRNKMALCEEIISIPSQRSSSGSMSTRPIPPSNSLVPSASTSHVDYLKKSGFSSFCSLPGTSHMAERLNCYSSEVMNVDTILMNSEFRILKPGTNQAFSARVPLKMTSECNLVRPFGFYNSMDSSAKKLGDENGIRVPYFGQSEKCLNFGSIGHNLENGKLTSSSLSPSRKHQTASERKEKETRKELKSNAHLSNQLDHNQKVSQENEECSETPPPLLTGKKILADAAPSLLSRNITAESGARALLPTNQTRNSSLVNDLSRLQDPCAQLNQESRSLPEKTASIYGVSGNPERLSRKRSFSMMEDRSCSSPTSRENNGIPNILGSVSKCPKSNDFACSQVEDAERSITISDTSVADSRAGFNISPDDVVGVLGLKLFWKLRRTIAHQQRVFAVQIFELHRLIKVQRLIAGSPEMLSEDKLCSGKPSIKCSPVKKLSQNISEPPSPFVKPKVASQKPNFNADCALEEACLKLVPLRQDSEKGRVIPKPILKPYSGALPSTSFAPDPKLGPWCFHSPAGNQWLVPVRSPSEGLIYKPYTGPCPPTTGCIAPVLGSPTNLTRVDADFMNTTTYGMPASGPAALGHPCLQSYALPMIDTANPSAGIDQQSSPFATRVRSTGQDHCFLSHNINYIIPHRSSCNTMGEKSWFISNFGSNLPVSKGSDFQGSNASSPSDRVPGDALCLFPTTPTVQASNHPVQNLSTEQRIQVIKVVPHNPKSACESAARIFRSIQEERKQHE